MKRRLFIPSICIVAALLAGCGGSTAVTPAPAKFQPPGGGGMNSNASIVLHVPAKSTKTKYISPAVQGVDFTTYAQSGMQVGYVFYPVNSSEPYCTVPSSGGLTCTLAIQAPAGTDKITVNTYDQAAPFQTPAQVYSNVLSTGTITATILPNVQNTISVVTSGVPYYTLLHVDNSYPAIGSPFSEPLHIEALDAQAYFIVGTYSQPLVLQSSTSHVSASPSTIPDSTTAAAETISYDGSSAATGTVTITETSAFGSGFVALHMGQSGLDLVPGALIFAHANASMQQAVLTGTGVTPTAPYSLLSWQSEGVNFSGTVPACSSATFTMTTTATNQPALDVTPVSAGACTVQVTDSLGNPAAVDIVVSP